MSPADRRSPPSPHGGAETAHAPTATGEAAPGLQPVTGQDKTVLDPRMQSAEQPNRDDEASQPTLPASSEQMALGRELSASDGAADELVIRPGDVINGYRIMRTIGQGGMGVVFEAEQVQIGKRVAIKVLLRQLAADQEAAERFLQEARAAARINSRHIVDVFGFGVLQDGRHYLVMQYLEGESLRSYLDRYGSLTFDQANPILVGVARGLHAAHRAGIIHRDIKPENLMLCEEEDGAASIKILDFGIAKLHGDQRSNLVTRTGAAMGTPFYMAPEQCRSEKVDARTDLYALGIIAYEMLTGQRPFTARSYIELVNKHLHASPVPMRQLVPDCPPALEALVLRCIAKDPQERPQDMQQLLQELSQLAPSLGRTRPSQVMNVLDPEVHETADRLQQSAAPDRRPPWLLMALALATLLGAIVALVLLLRTPGQPPQSHGAVSHAAPGRGADARQVAGALPAGATPPGPATAPTASSDAQAAPRRAATLEVTTGLASASYRLDGQRVGRGAQLQLKRAATGRHTLVITAPGHRRLSRPVELRAGQTLRLTLRLEPRRPAGVTHRPSSKTQARPHRQEDPDETLDPFKSQR